LFLFLFCFVSFALVSQASQKSDIIPKVLYHMRDAKEESYLGKIAIMALEKNVARQQWVYCGTQQ